MKVTEEQETTRTYEVVVKRVCDICGTESDGTSWSGGTYTINDTTIAVKVVHEDGHDFPEGGDKVVTEIDLCPICFQDKLVPWVEEQGDTTIEKEAIDW